MDVPKEKQKIALDFGNKVCELARELFMQTGVIIDSMHMKLIDKKSGDYNVRIRIDLRKD